MADSGQRLLKTGRGRRHTKVLTGVFAGALITGWLGKSTDAGNLGRDLALLVIPVALAL